MKICVVTTNRSEYGLLKWIMKELSGDDNFDLKIIVTGSHLLKKYGHTITEILEDGFKINSVVENINDLGSKLKIVQSMGYYQIRLASIFSEIKPELLIVLGDRYELLPVCSAALLLDIPIAHISGGDITEGAVDDQIRHSISKMATIHFPSIESSAKRLMKMGESPENIFIVGEPGLEGVLKAVVPGRKEIAESLGLSVDKKWIIGTYHPETRVGISSDLNLLLQLLEFLSDKREYEILFTSSNSDSGGQDINEILIKYSKKHTKHSFHIQSRTKKISWFFKRITVNDW